MRKTSKKQKTPRDINQLAKFIVDQTTKELSVENKPPSTKRKKTKPDTDNNTSVS